MSSNNVSSNTLPAKQVARIATFAIVGIAYFLIAVLALHFLRPDYNPIRRLVSEYAVGPYAFLMTSAFFGLSWGSLALVIGLSQAVSRTWRSWLGLFFLGTWAVGITIAGIFPAGSKNAFTSASIHELASILSFFSLVIAALLLSWYFKQDEKWSSFHRPALILSGLMLLALIGFFWFVNTAYAGLSQRIFIAMVLMWLLLTASRLRYVATGSLQSDKDKKDAG
jgi:hypothetical protein